MSEHVPIFGTLVVDMYHLNMLSSTKIKCSTLRTHPLRAQPLESELKGVCDDLRYARSVS